MSPRDFACSIVKDLHARQGDLDGQDSEQAQSKQIFRGHLRFRQGVMIDTMVL